MDVRSAFATLPGLHRHHALIRLVDAEPGDAPKHQDDTRTNSRLFATFSLLYPWTRPTRRQHYQVMY